MDSKAEVHSRARKDPDFRRRRIRLLLFMGAVASLLFIANLIYAMSVYTRNGRSYCLTCHRQDGPAARWTPSRMHSPGMACFPCHGVLAGQHGRRGAFSGHPATVNPNCMGCHARVVGGKPLAKVVEIVGPPGPAGGMSAVGRRWPLRDLMYTWHIRNRACICTDCHRNVAHDRAQDPVSPNLPKVAYCGECHYHGAKGEYVGEKYELRITKYESAGKEAAGIMAQGGVPSEPKEWNVPAENAVIYGIAPRIYHRKGEDLVRKSGKDCEACHVPRYYPQKDFFGWEYRKKWMLQWGMFSVAAFFVFLGLYSAGSIWAMGRRPSLHRSVHWPSVLWGLVRNGILGERIWRQSRLRWAIFWLISMAMLVLAVVFVLTLVARFVLPAGFPYLGWALLALDFLADLLGLCIFMGVLLAFCRRTRGRKKGLGTDLEDLAILLLLLGVVVTGFFLEACRLAVVSPAPHMWASFLGALGGDLLRRWDLPWTVIRFYVWIVHAFFVFALLAYIPFSKLFHLMAAPVTIAAAASEKHYRQRL